MASNDSLSLSTAVQLFPTPRTPFDLRSYLAQEERRVQRALRAAINVGARSGGFRHLTPDQRMEKVWEWIEEALDARAARLAGREMMFD